MTECNPLPFTEREAYIWATDMCKAQRANNFENVIRACKTSPQLMEDVFNMIDDKHGLVSAIYLAKDMMTVQSSTPCSLALFSHFVFEVDFSVVCDVVMKHFWGTSHGLNLDDATKAELQHYNERVTVLSECVVSDSLRSPYDYWYQILKWMRVRKVNVSPPFPFEVFDMMRNTEDLARVMSMVCHNWNQFLWSAKHAYKKYLEDLNDNRSFESENEPTNRKRLCMTYDESLHPRLHHLQSNALEERKKWKAVVTRMWPAWYVQIWDHLTHSHKWIKFHDVTSAVVDDNLIRCNKVFNINLYGRTYEINLEKLTQQKKHKISERNRPVAQPKAIRRGQVCNYFSYNRSLQRSIEYTKYYLDKAHANWVTMHPDLEKK